MPQDYGAILPMGSDWSAKPRTGYRPQGWTQQGEQNFYMNQEAAMGRTHAPTFGGMQRAGGGYQYGATGQAGVPPWQQPGGGREPIWGGTMGGADGDLGSAHDATLRNIGNGYDMGFGPGNYGPLNPGGGQMPGFGGSNIGQVSTSIQPRAPYTPDMTARARNLAVAENQRSGNLNYLQKAFDRPGVSRSAGTVRAAMPFREEAYTKARLASAGIPMADMLANTRSLLEGQVNREQEAQGWGSLGLRRMDDYLDYDRRLQGLGMQGFGSLANFFG